MENGTIEQLVASAKQGDNQAFRELYDYSYEVVQKECLKNLHNSIDAEDAMQETYLSIFRRLDSLKDPQKFLGWARTIAHNTCVDYIVHQKRKVGKDDFKPPVSDDRFEGMDKIDLEDEELSPEDKAEQDMIHGLLQTALDDIPIQRATCLALYQQGISYREISEQLSIPMGTVKSNVYYAKKALKKKIEKIERVYITQSSPDALAAEQDCSKYVKAILRELIKASNPDVTEIQFLEDDWSWNGTTLTIGTNVMPVLKTQSAMEDYKYNGSNTAIVSDYIFFQFHNIYKDPKTGMFTPEIIQGPKRIIIQINPQDGQRQVVKLKTEY